MGHAVPGAREWPTVALSEGREVTGHGAIGWRCGQHAPRRLWAKVYRGDRVPVKCNRAPGHDGPHRFTRPEDFAVLAEWSDAEVPSK